jgi:L-rhamnose mutarotase
MEYRAYRMRLKKDNIEEYTRIHRKGNIWQPVVDGLAMSGIERMIILRDGQDLILFEAAKDLKASYDSLALDGPSAAWDRMVAGLMEEYPRLSDLDTGGMRFDQVNIVFNYDRGAIL